MKKMYTGGMTFHYSESYSTENPGLPLLRSVIEKSTGESLTKDQIDQLCEKIGALISDTVPILGYMDISDTMLYESGFEKCTDIMIENLKRIGIEVKK